MRKSVFQCVSSECLGCFKNPLTFYSLPFLHNVTSTISSDSSVISEGSKGRFGFVSLASDYSFLKIPTIPYNSYDLLLD